MTGVLAEHVTPTGLGQMDSIINAAVSIFHKENVQTFKKKSGGNRERKDLLSANMSAYTQKSNCKCEKKGKGRKGREGRGRVLTD